MAEATLNEEELDCGELRYDVKKDEGRLICTAQAVPTDTTTERTLQVNLQYTYSEEISQKIKILKKTET